MSTAKLFKHGGSQAVRLPKKFRFEGTEVLIEKKDDAVILRPKPRLKTLGDLARYMHERFADAPEFPARRQPREQQKRDVSF